MRGRLTYANVMSTIAVFLALGLGGAWAAHQLKKNSVSTKQVKNESLKSKDLKNGKGVTGDDVVDGSLGGVDLGANAVGSDKITDGSLIEGDLAKVKFHAVGAAGEPPFSDGGEGDCLFRDFFDSEDGFNPVGFYRDVAGVVHLTGNVIQVDRPVGDTACTTAGDRPEQIEDGTIFTLPTGFRPDHIEYQNILTGVSNGADPAVLEIVGDEPAETFFGDTLQPGQVFLERGSQTSTLMGLDGITFRAAP